MIKMFKIADLKITIQAGLRIVNFIDVQFNLNNGTYQPCGKPDNTRVYIYKNSNRPPLLLKQLPKSISDISSDENVFQNLYYFVLSKKSLNLVVIVDQRPIAHLTTNA